MYLTISKVAPFLDKSLLCGAIIRRNASSASVIVKTKKEYEVVYYCRQRVANVP